MSTIPIGAVVVDREGTIVSQGRNRIFDHEAPLGQVAGTAIAHAELNALLQLKRSDSSRSTYAIYTAVEPCPLCAGAIYMSSLREVHYAARDGYAGSTNLYGATPYLQVKPIRVHGPHAGLEDVVMTLNVEYFIRNGERHRLQDLLDRWGIDTPKSVALGQALTDSGELQYAAKHNWTAGQVVDFLATRLGGNRKPGLDLIELD